MEVKQEGRRHGRHLVFVLYPFQGRISPMLELATILHSTGFSITIVHPQFNSPSPLSHPPDFTFISIPDPLSQGKVSPGDVAATLSALNNDSEQPFRRCMEDMVAATVDEANDRVACIVYDGMMYFAQGVADHLKLPAIFVRTGAAITLITFASLPHPQHHGSMSLQGTACIKFD